MKLTKVDFCYLCLVVIVFTTWNFGGNKQVYYELHAKLRKQQEVLPETVINPLAAFAGTRQKNVDEMEQEGGDEESDGAFAEGEESGGEENGEEEEEDGMGSSSSASSSSSSASSFSQDALEEGLEKAKGEFRKSMLDDSILGVKIYDMRKSMENGLLSADTRFSFEVTVPPEELTQTWNMDEEEREFAEKLKERIEEWTKLMDDIDHASLHNSIPKGEDSALWEERVKDHREWQETEMNRLREEIRGTDRFTLSGREVKDADYYEQDISHLLSESNEFTDEESSGDDEGDGDHHHHNHHSHSDDDSGDDGDGNDDDGESYAEDSGDEDDSDGSSHSNRQHHHHGKTIKVDIDDEDIAEFKDLVIETEKEISYWAHSNDRSVYVYGKDAYVHRDFETYNRAFSGAGFKIDKRKKEGPLSSKVLAGNEHSVLICLALKNDDCFSSQGLAKVKRYQRINRILGLRAVLWSKDSFCKTINSGTKGEALFASYTFNCWLFPNEWTSAREYAQNHPTESFIVKPLTMGGGKGITVVDGEKGLAKIRHRTHLVQNYLHNPHLIDGYKWDLRTYVLVTSTVPMRAYVFSRGLVRFASSVYDPNAKKGGKRSQYLTNTSVNKKYAKDNVTDITWSFDDLKGYFDKTDEDMYDTLMKKIQTAISIVFLSAEQEWRRYYNSKSESCPNCFQIMGVDLIVDANMNPRVIEVNGQPNMKLSNNNNDHYSITKMKMMQDMVHMIFGTESVSNELLHSLQGVDDSLLRTLSKSEWEYVIEYIKERKHRGLWQKVYPNLENSDLHSKFLEQQKRNPARLALHDVLMHLEKTTLNMKST